MIVLSLAVCLAPLLCAAPAAAQIPGAIEGSVGWAGLLDESIIEHAVFGVAAPITLTPRLRVGPELHHLRGPNRARHYLFSGTVWFDLLGGERPVTPYLVFGGGWMHTTFGTYDFTQGAAGGGGGVRIAVSDRIYFAPEARFGTELLMRSTLSVGYRW